MATANADNTDNHLRFFNADSFDISVGATVHVQDDDPARDYLLTRNNCSDNPASIINDNNLYTYCTTGNNDGYYNRTTDDLHNDNLTATLYTYCTTGNNDGYYDRTTDDLHDDNIPTAATIVDNRRQRQKQLRA
jgi:hypothetical protein